MDILIKGMELPKEGNVYLIIGEDGVVSEKIGSMYHVTTEAIELPPHGRLIDADALIEQTNNWYCSKENCGDNYNGIKCRACWVDDAVGIIDDAPTVVGVNYE